MEEKRRKRRDFIQNVSIALLSVTAVLLFAQTQLYLLGTHAGSSYLGLLSGSSSQTDTVIPGQQSTLTAPVRIAVTGTYGRYGNVALTTADDAFRPLAGLLREVLGSARTPKVCAEGEFLDALSGASVYYDFLSPLPLSVIAGFVGASWSGELSARRLAVSVQETGVSLYLLDDGGNCFSCATAVPVSDLADVIGSYELGNDSFAFERAETNDSYLDIAPCSLLLKNPPELPVLSVGNSLSNSDWLLSALGFNPNTKFRNTDSSGTEVIAEGDAVLRIRTDSSISYKSGGEKLLSIDAAGDIPTLEEAATECGLLLNSILSSAGGNATLYLEDIQQSGSSTLLRFAYQVGGVPVQIPGGAAAEITLSGTTVSALSLRLRQYTVSSDTSPLLPQRQAVAIAARQQGAELTIGYADNGGSSVSANWLAD